MAQLANAVPMSTAQFSQLLSAREIVVCCGSGGVGKTSVAASIAWGAAHHRGAKVLVLTVDPAKRLATALGLESLGNRELRVEGPRISDTDAPGVGATGGELWAAMLDTKQSWDELVMRHAPDEATAHRILHNSLYTTLTARFVQSHDYIAMERLYDLHSSGKYDLIVIDTPPTRNAVDFLDAPERMAEFFGGRLLRWLTLPYRVGGGRGARVVNVASRPLFQVADRLLGSRFLQDIAEFFLNFQSMYDGFVERANAVEALLHDRRTTFVVVTTPESAPLQEGQRFCAELDSRKLHLGAMIVNRTLPGYFCDAEALQSARRLAEEPSAVTDALGTTNERDRDSTNRVLHTIGTSFERFHSAAANEQALLNELRTQRQMIVTIPNRDTEIADTEGLAWIARHLFEPDEKARTS